MEKFKQYLLATAGLAILVGGLTLLGPAVPQAVPPAKDVNVINDANNPVPVTVQNAANDDGQPFEFSGTFQNPGGTYPGCITPHDVFTVPGGETFVATDILLTATSEEVTVTIQRDDSEVFPSINLFTSPAPNPWGHAFQTGLVFSEHETLRLTDIRSDFNSPTASCKRGTAAFLITGIRTTS